MIPFKGRLKALLILTIVALSFSMLPTRNAQSAMNDYCVQPPFVAQTIPPLVMLVMSRDHKLFYKAYNDIVDLNDDGVVDSTYNDTIDYYGYFHPNVCYVYNNDRFEPSSTAAGTNSHYCTSKWSGNFLNWSSMSRIDILRKVMYGGKRISDTSSLTVLSRALLPQDAHSWAKAYTGTDISSLTPVNWSAITLCNTNTSSTQTSSRMFAIRGNFPYAASTEGKQCTKTVAGGSDLTRVDTLGDVNADAKYVRYYTDVKVCDGSVGLEANCDNFGSSYKPGGLIQRFGTDRKGTDDTSDDKTVMYFGLMTGSYAANASGGVLRRNIKDVPSTEVDNTNGQIKGSSSKIIKNIDNFKIIQYDYDTGWYDLGGSEGTCVPGEPYVLADGTCKSWGNPVGEMYYEALRYFQGRAAATSQFNPSNPDSGISNLTVESQWCDPYTSSGSCTAFPFCSKPFVLVMSDVFPSFDSDQLPGSNWPTSISTSHVPSVQTLITNSGINTLEAPTNVFMGEAAGSYDRQCSSKAGSNFSTMRGLCVEEPTKQGSYYVAGLAHYGKTTDQHATASGDQKVTTYVVATESVPAIEVAVGSSKVKILPTFHDGCPNTSISGCTSQGQGGDNSKGELVYMNLCPNDADWTTEKGNGYTSCHDIMWDDAEYGWDYDLDISMRIYIKTSGSTITVKSKGRYAAAGHTDYAGYIISGVSASGTYYDVRCGGDAGFSTCQRYDGNATASVERTFTATGTTAGLLKDPLWYAAKYGGFDDKNGNNKPDLQPEWDRDNDGVPDTYFYAANPLKLEEQLSKALTDILRKASSGTAASILSSSEGSGANIVQAVFYPWRVFGADDVYWSGELHNLWYYIDPYLTNSTIREDTTEDNILHMVNDYVAGFYFDTGDGTAKAARSQDTDGDGDGDSVQGSVSLEELKDIWRAGEPLWSRNLGTSPRTIYTSTNGTSFLSGNFSVANKTTLTSFLNAASSTEAEKIINWIHGTDQTGYRRRSATIDGTTSTWRLGDVVSSTPRIQASVPLNTYHKDNVYADSTYQEFIEGSSYQSRGMVYAGANDGMLHAFKLGTLEQKWSGQGTYEKARLTGTDLGKEMWAYVPKNALPYLKYLADNNYCHLYYVDAPSFLVDASIGGASWDAGKTSASWKTVLIGGMGLGGACRNTGTSCTNCVKTPISDVGYSSYFALDVSDPNSPSLMWEFSNAQLGYSTSGAAVVRIGDKSENGKWFAIFASGPTGPIDTSSHQFLGKSDQNLRLFIVDLKTGTLVRTIDTGISNAFAGSLFLSTFDAERGWDRGGSGYYKDDVVYIGYTKLSGTTWTDGGVLRLTTKEDTNPANWVVSTVIDGIGPVTSAVSKLQDTKKNEEWLFFGSGRYFYKLTSGVDDPTNQRKIFGLKEPCYNTSNRFEKTCTTTLELSNLTDQTTSPVATLPAGSKGWYVTLDPTGTTDSEGRVYNAERVITDPLAVFSGVVFFTTFAPSADVCAMGGNTFIWALKHNTGSQTDVGAMEGKILIQVSTGEIKELSLPGAFSGKGGRQTAAILGMPPRGQGLSVLMKPQPVKKILHIEEK